MNAGEPRFCPLGAGAGPAAEATGGKARLDGTPLSRQELLALFAELRPLGYLASVLPSEHGPGLLGFAALVEGLSPTLALLGNHSVQRYLHAYGTDAQKQRFLLPLLDAKSIAAIAITEPQAGADLNRLETTAERSGSIFVLRGRKTWLTHGLTADAFIVLARTADGPTRFIVPGDTPGLRRTQLDVVGLNDGDRRRNCRAEPLRCSSTPVSPAVMATCQAAMSELPVAPRAGWPVPGHADHRAKSRAILPP